MSLWFVKAIEGRPSRLRESLELKANPGSLFVLLLVQPSGFAGSSSPKAKSPSPSLYVSLMSM